MRVDESALREAAQDIFTSLGPLDDLGAELSNTVANIYYRFHSLSQNMGNPSEALGVKLGKDVPLNFYNVTVAMGRATTEYKYIDKMIKSLREAKAEDASVGAYLIQHAIDHFKYHITNADKKSPIRRLLERPFCKVDEIAGLYVRMVQLAGEVECHSPLRQLEIQALFDSVEDGDIDSLRQFIRTHPSEINITRDGWTLLHLLGALGSATLPVHSIMADELVRAGADVNSRTKLGWTPIHMIAIGGQKKSYDLAKVLIAHGADLTATANDGISDWRIFWQHGKEIWELLEREALRQSRR